ncbi:hypothetical protein SUGI_0604740 [Cryptomeria japonica]|uniref:tRNA A64-2'-O-ribosylphosphate transferase n=1 Tax=Cryptomeria japonica TaxID=3369 RepID=UPI002414C265|nr:tRNA A64-2'-O-ribosylphosphate transferase [Cryptomeria japonica]GLJ30544.1 hypothetical protein SUGI_0604740 [Cryptomeria japonica]
MDGAEDNSLNIYKICRKIKRTDQSLYNALRSIYQDSLFVSEIRRLWPELPLMANLRCGLWYSQQFDDTCYFKSTDGHTGNWSFNPIRLNIHVATIAAEKGGCIIVDATRKGKRFPDSMSKTIPIWICVLNRAIQDFRRANLTKCSEALQSTCSEMSNVQDCQHQRMNYADGNAEPNLYQHRKAFVNKLDDWDCSLHLPLWVSDSEKANIESRIEGWTKILEATGTDLMFLAKSLRRPLRPLWISQKTVIWLNEVPDLDSWDFTPVILVSASSSMENTKRMSDDEYSWRYIPGAADDEESWARVLSPSLFWKHSFDLISGGPEACNKMVADIVERDRVYRAQRGQEALQIKLKLKKITTDVINHLEEGFNAEFQSVVNTEGRFFSVERTGKPDQHGIQQLPQGQFNLYWIGTTRLAISTSEYARLGDGSGQFDSILNCDTTSFLPRNGEDTFIHLPILGSKFDRFDLQNNLPSAVEFARKKLERGQTLLVCCSNGEDISVCICLAILMSLFDVKGTFDNGRSFGSTAVSKWDVRRQLVYICNFATNARPSRGNLRQVFNFLIRE